MIKTILITGSTDGIGKLAALKFAKEGHQLYLHGRDSMKLRAVIAQLKKASGNDKIEGIIADFSDLNDVTKMAEEVNEKLPKLDVLINNAGVFKSSEPLTKEGIDIRMVVNYLAPYLLTTKIIDKLRTSPESRIINLSSAAQSSVSLDLLDGKSNAADHEAYAQSKLAILMWSFYLAQQEPKVAVLALNPGSLLNTNMVRKAYRKVLSSADKGADIIYDSALSIAHNDINGKYFDNDKGSFGTAHPDAYDMDTVNTLIEKTEDILNVSD